MSVGGSFGGERASAPLLQLLLEALDLALGRFSPADLCGNRVTLHLTIAYPTLSNFRSVHGIACGERSSRGGGGETGPSAGQDDHAAGVGPDGGCRHNTLWHAMLEAAREPRGWRSSALRSLHRCR